MSKTAGSSCPHLLSDDNGPDERRAAFIFRSENRMRGGTPRGSSMTGRFTSWKVAKALTGASLLLALAYATVFWLGSRHIEPADLILWSLCNAVPHVVLALPLADGVAPLVMRHRPARGAAIAALAIMAYALIAYCAIVFLLAATHRIDRQGMIVQFFSGPALLWETFQGLAYGVIGLLIGLLLIARRELEDVRSAQAATYSPPRNLPPARWLVRTADGIVPVDPGELIRIEAAGEYCQLILPQRSILARISMNECEERLRVLHFLRVHRSHLVNSDRLISAEAAGNGRLQLNLSNGDRILTSRQGARLVRASTV